MNPYIAILTKGTTSEVDYHWKTSGISQGKSYEIISRLCDEQRSFAVVRHEHGFDTLIKGISAGLGDFRGRNVGIAIAFCNIADAEARALVLMAIEDAQRFDTLVLGTVTRPAPAEWSIDEAAANRILSDARQRLNQQSDTPAFQDAWELCFVVDEGAPEKLEQSVRNLENLTEELKSHSFSEGAGVKLLVSTAPSQDGYERARVEADRFLWADGASEDLEKLRKKNSRIQLHHLRCRIRHRKRLRQATPLLPTRRNRHQIAGFPQTKYW